MKDPGSDRMHVRRSFVRTENLLLLAQIAGDCLATFAGLALGYWVRFETPLRGVGVEADSVSFAVYQPLLLIGMAFFVGSYAYLKVYDGRLLLRPYQALLLLARGTLFWFVAFLGSSLALKFDPSVSRLFVAISCLTTFAVVGLWRYAFFRWLRASTFRDRIVQRVALIGWSEDAGRLIDAVRGDPNHPYEIVGVVPTHRESPAKRRDCRELGALQNLEDIFRRDEIDIAIVADFDLETSELLRISALCERLYVQFKVLPSFFRIFVSSLKFQTISGVPVLGVEELRIMSVMNSLVKRVVDIVGALVGLAISAPIIACLGFLVSRESPGPVIFKQVRVGRHGRHFTILKLRSMRLDAERSGAQWAVEADPRRLRIGAFMREWNLDELPQFWNVLVGDMSLVGPRPERPELIERFEREIPHYNPRHEVRPGLTGWAQVNGLRGNTSLVERVKYDLYYIENWSPWFDMQIMVLTFVRRKNAY